MKLWKHETNHVAGGLTFSPFVLDCFGGIGFQAARFLCTLSFWNLGSPERVADFFEKGF